MLQPLLSPRVRTLYYLPYSAWSWKAKWALAHHQLRCEEKVYAPVLGEAPLRLMTQNFTRKLTVPVLLDKERALTDSFEIARYAESVGAGAPLFFDRDACAHWNEVSELALSAGRTAAIKRIERDREGQADSLRGLLPDALREPLAPLAKAGAGVLLRKYGATPPSQLEGALDRLRAHLGGHDHIVGDRLSYADIAMAVTLEFVEPRLTRRAPGYDRCAGDLRLASRYADLLQWRDRLIDAAGIDAR